MLSHGHITGAHLPLIDKQLVPAGHTTQFIRSRLAFWVYVGVRPQGTRMSQYNVLIRDKNKFMCTGLGVCVPV